MSTTYTSASQFLASQRKWLKPEDLYPYMPSGIAMKILRVNVEELPVPGKLTEKRPAVVITYYRATKRHILNQTQLKVIANLYGDDFKGWIDQQLLLTVGTLPNGKETVVVSKPKPKAPVDASDAEFNALPSAHAA